MTILEELIDLGLKTCEKSRQSGQKHIARAAVLLGSPSNPKVFTGCDVFMVPNNELTGVSAERAALLSAVADGVGEFEV